MTTTTLARRRPRGMYPQQRRMQQNSGGKGSTLPEYLEQAEVEALIRAAPNPQETTADCRAAASLSQVQVSQLGQTVPQAGGDDYQLRALYGLMPNTLRCSQSE